MPLLPTLFDVCTPREDVLQGVITGADFAADLAQVLKGTAPKEYQNPAEFFANTHPTRGLKNLLHNVCLRLNADSDQVSPIFRLNTNYGGGKTHALIALVHTVGGMAGVTNIDEFIDSALLPKEKVRVAAFDGENADPANGRLMGDGIRAHTPWGELAYELAGVRGYRLVQKSDESGTAPGAETLQDLLGNGPTLILMDELSIYLRKQEKEEQSRAAGQIAAFLSVLFKAVISSSRAALVYTLAIGKDTKAVDAYGRENEDIAQMTESALAQMMEEAESISARTATLLDPTEEDETVKILRRRLFSNVDESGSEKIIQAYARLWNQEREHLQQSGLNPQSLDAFRDGFPLHPELIATLQEKTSTLSNFQRVRGMLRLLARTVSVLWNKHPSKAYAIHLWNIDLSNSAIRQEFVTKLGQKDFVPALKADISSTEGDQPSLAEEIDANNYSGMPPFAVSIARTIFIHSLAFNEALKGLSKDELLFSILSPSMDAAYIENATRKFVLESAYMDDRPNHPMRFQAEANLTQIIRKQERQVDPGEVRTRLNDMIKEVFNGETFRRIFSPAMPSDISDSQESRPALAVMGYEASDVTGEYEVKVPELVSRLYQYKGSSEEPRLRRNNLVFVVVDKDRIEPMKQSIRRLLALEDLRLPELLKDLADHQKKKIEELGQKAVHDAAIAIQQAYRHVFYPSKNRLNGADVDIAHTTVEIPNAAANPGEGQRQVVRVLANKLRQSGDSPDAPEFIISKTPLKNGQIALDQLRDEYRQNPALPILVGDGILSAAVREGINSGKLVYKNGDLIVAKDTPLAEIKIDGASFVFTAGYARDNAIWPKPKPMTVPKQISNDTAFPISATSGVDTAPSFDGSGGNSDSQAPGTNPQVPISDNNETDSSTEPVEPVFEVEAPLREAFLRLWEKLRSKKISAVSELSIEIFDVQDALRVIGLASSIPNVNKKLSTEGGYETKSGSTVELNFEGTTDDFQNIKDFLTGQLRAAEQKSFDTTIFLNFEEGLCMNGNGPETLADRLTKVGCSAAYVKAKAKV